MICCVLFCVLFKMVSEGFFFNILFEMGKIRLIEGLILGGFGLVL